MNKPVPKVNSGVPWWLWVVMIPITGAVIFGVLTTSASVEPQELYEERLQALVSFEGTKEEADNTIARLKTEPGFENKVVLLESLLDSNRNRHPRALKKLQQIVDDEELRPFVLERIAFSHIKCRDYNGAEAAYNDAIATKDPDAVHAARLGLAVMYGNIGAYELAIEVATEGLKQNEDENGLRMMRGSSYTELQEYEKAVADFETCLLYTSPSPRDS